MHTLPKRYLVLHEIGSIVGNEKLDATRPAREQPSEFRLVDFFEDLPKNHCLILSEIWASHVLEIGDVDVVHDRFDFATVALLLNFESTQRRF